MNVLAYYTDRMEPLTSEKGITEQALVLRRGKTMSPRTIADGRVMLVDLGTQFVGGDILKRQNGEQYFIISKQQSSDCVQMQGKRVNAYITIRTLADKYVNHKKVGTEEKTIAENCPTYYQDVSAVMHTYDAGLLPKTVKKIIIHNSVPVKLLDRVSFGERDYQIDNIDTAKYVGLYELQLSEDTRQ